jgi:peptidoglycan hydrolase-like protein with peptidoglycan-binding domain
MKRFFAALTISAMLIVPLVAVAASSSGGNLPAAVDELLARDMIQQAQLQLKMAGYDPGRTDGIFDAKTSATVGQYQAANGLPVSGLLDEATRLVMFPGFNNVNEE